MNEILVVSVAALWVVTLATFVCTMRVARALRMALALPEHGDHGVEAEELAVGSAAPHFEARAPDGTAVSARDLAGAPVAYVFVSPNCGACRTHLGPLERLAPLARAADGTRIVLVSDAGARSTAAWLEEAVREDGLAGTLPVLIAPRSDSQLGVRYNPLGFFPYFCLVDGEGVVRARAVLGREPWMAAIQEWEERVAVGTR